MLQTIKNLKRTPVCVIIEQGMFKVKIILCIKRDFRPNNGAIYTRTKHIKEKGSRVLNIGI